MKNFILIALGVLCMIGSDIQSADNNQLLTQIKEIALDQLGNNKFALGPIQTVDQYLQSHKNLNKNILKSVTKNISSCEYIIDSRGDGNCGYRSILSSIFMNAVKFEKFDFIFHLKNLINDKYNHLFMIYDEQFEEESQEIVAQEIKRYLQEQLQNI